MELYEVQPQIQCPLKNLAHLTPPDARQTRISAPRIHIPSPGIKRGFALIQMHLPHVLLQPFFVDILKTTLKTNYNTNMQNEFICKNLRQHKVRGYVHLFCVC